MEQNLGHYTLCLCLYRDRGLILRLLPLPMIFILGYKPIRGFEQLLCGLADSTSQSMADHLSPKKESKLESN